MSSAKSCANAGFPHHTAADFGACALFDTGIGACGIAWRGGAIVAVQLPEPDPVHTLVRMLRFTGALPQVPLTEAPVGVQRAAEGVQALMRGEPRDLCEVVLDMRGVSDFYQRVYAIARCIRPGQTRTYGDLAEELGDKHLARAVGQALGFNPFAPIVPCHRVLAAHGKPGGFSGGWGPVTKLKMLSIEGAALGGTRSLFD